MIKRLSIILSAITALSLSGCVNDALSDVGGGYDGPVSLTLDLHFNPLAEGLSTRGVDANLDFELRDLTILFYESTADETTGKPVKVVSRTSPATEQEERISDTEPHTRHTQIVVDDLQAGQTFRVYAVANVASALAGTNWSDLSEKTLREQVIYFGDYAENTAYGAKDPRRYSIPDAMFGYFHVSTNSSHDAEHKAEAGMKEQDIIHHTPSLWNYDKANGDREITDNRAVAISLSSRQITIHAWLKRTISRLTVGYDGSQLNRGVEIYVKSLHIRNAMSQCWLGHDNAADGTLFVTDDTSDERLHLVYSEGEGVDDNEIISRTYPYYPRESKASVEGDNKREAWYGYVHGTASTLDPKDADASAYTPRALYFMENIQGKVYPYDGPKEFPKAYDEAWQEGGDYDYDDKPYGTYIEVEAYYVNKNRKSQGRIFYRFMLGQNITDDFNAERNRHYRLTLMFKGNANDVDWHIDYEEEKNPYFRIPYNLGDEDADYAFEDAANSETWFKNENWNQSYVWYAYDEEHNPIAEICKELIYYDDDYTDTNTSSHKFYQVVTVYPIDENGITDLKNGLVVQVLDCDDNDETAETYYTKTGGANISMIYRYDLPPQYRNGLNRDKAQATYYTISDCGLTPEIMAGGEGSHANYLYIEYDRETHVLTPSETPKDLLLDTRPYLVSDKDGNNYPIVKVGASYWFRENLRSTTVYTADEILGVGYDEPTVVEPWHSGVSSYIGGKECIFFNEAAPMYKTLSDDPDGSKYGLLYNLAAVAGSSECDAWTTNEDTWSGCDGWANAVIIQLEDRFLNLDLDENPYLESVNDWQLTPKGWHIPVGATDRQVSNEEMRSMGQVWQDHQYLLFYLDNDFFRATRNKGNLIWPETNYSSLSLKKKNLSGMSLLAIPADGQSSSLSYYIDEDCRKTGDISKVIIPYWTTALTFYKYNNSNYGLYAFPPIFDNSHFSDEDKEGKLESDEWWIGPNAEMFFKNLNASYMHVRPCRNSLPESYAAQPWSVLGSMWEGEE